MQALQAVSPEDYAGKYWKHPGNYSYAADLHFVPVVAGELLKAAAYLPLVFAKLTGSFQLMAVMSLQPGTNLLVGPQGQWLGGYIPALLRGYPFTLLQSDKGEYTVYSTTEGEHIVTAEEGAPYFDAQGKLSPESQKAVDYLTEVMRSRAQTQRAINALAAAGLIVPWQLATNHNGETQAVEGVYRLDEAKLSTLKPQQLVKLRDEGALPIAYAQLFAREHFSHLQRAAQEQERLRSPGA